MPIFHRGPRIAPLLFGLLGLGLCLATAYAQTPIKVPHVDMLPQLLFTASGLESIKSQERLPREPFAQMGFKIDGGNETFFSGAFLTSKNDGSLVLSKHEDPKFPASYKRLPRVLTVLQGQFSANLESHDAPETPVSMDPKLLYHFQPSLSLKKVKMLVNDEPRSFLVWQVDRLDMRLFEEFKTKGVREMTKHSLEGEKGKQTLSTINDLLAEIQAAQALGLSPSDTIEQERLLGIVFSKLGGYLREEAYHNEVERKQSLTPPKVSPPTTPTPPSLPYRSRPVITENPLVNDENLAPSAI